MRYTLLYQHKELGTIIADWLPSFLWACEQKKISYALNVEKKSIEIFPPVEQVKWVLASKSNNVLTRHLLFKLRTMLQKTGVEIELVAEEDLRVPCFILFDFDAKKGEEDSVSCSFQVCEKNLSSRFLTTWKEMKMPGELITNVNSNESMSFTGEVMYTSQQSYNLVVEKLATMISIALFDQLSINAHPDVFLWLSTYKEKEEVILNKEEVKPLEQKSTSRKHIPKVLQAETFFNYQILFQQEEQKVIATGELFIRNVGNEKLSNPLICIKITPSDAVKFRGQIIPPEMVEGLSVQGKDLQKGWRYAYENWFEHGTEKGEYWVTPIQPITCLPNETVSLPNIQFLIPMTPNHATVKVESFVTFQEENVQTRALNQMTFRFTDTKS